MIRKIALIAFVVVCSTTSFAHKFYVSIANMEYNDKDNKIDVSLKMTAHDFEHILGEKYQKVLHIEDIADSSEIGLYIQQYLAENFQVSSGGEQLKMTYYGKEVTLRDELFFYLSFEAVVNPKTIQIKNQLLFSKFAQQQNIVHYKYGEQTKSVTLVPSVPSGEIKLD